jgi:hypothetical protein
LCVRSIDRLLAMIGQLHAIRAQQIESTLERLEKEVRRGEWLPSDDVLAGRLERVRRKADEISLKRAEVDSPFR